MHCLVLSHSAATTLASHDLTALVSIFSHSDSTTQPFQVPQPVGPAAPPLGLYGPFNQHHIPLATAMGCSRHGLCSSADAPVERCPTGPTRPRQDFHIQVHPRHGPALQASTRDQNAAAGDGYAFEAHALLLHMAASAPSLGGNFPTFQPFHCAPEAGYANASAALPRPGLSAPHVL
jgi:hypothetical protein